MDWFLDLSRPQKVGAAFVPLGISTYLYYFHNTIWLWGWGIGIVLFLAAFSFSDD
jgi:hypothetical protein